jgi:hypothetical protein
VLRNRRNAAALAASDPAAAPMPPDTEAERQEMTDAASADVNGQVRTP